MDGSGPGLIIVGIDEAGFGPLLGPMCVAASAWFVPGWREGDPAPDLWKVLAAGVGRKPLKSRRVVPIADSKALKLANDTVGQHPLVYLERGVLSALHVLGRTPTDDGVLLGCLDACLGTYPWYAAGGPVPVAHRAEEMGIYANMLAAALRDTGVRLLDIWCECIDEQSFNAMIRERQNKAEVTIEAVGRIVTRARERCAGRWREFMAGAGESGCVESSAWFSDSASETISPSVEQGSASSRGTSRGAAPGVRVVCDRLGGRAAYRGIIERWLPGARVEVVHESANVSRYHARTAGLEEFAAGFSFEVDSESRHLPIALASMTAKYVRELAMARFNRYWCARQPELKATAGYRNDAWRWLREAVVSPEDRERLVRLA